MSSVTQQVPSLAVVTEAAAQSNNPKFIRSIRGKFILCLGGFIYHVNKTVAGVMYWDCEKSIPCKGRAISEKDIENTARMTAAHNHEPNAMRVEIANFRSELFNHAHGNNAAPKKIIRQVASKTPAEVLSSLSRVAQRKVIQRSRTEDDDLAEPNENFDNVSERFTRTLDGETFLQRNIESPGGRILIFTTTKNIRLLSQAPVWMMDGTFSTAPKGFCQIFSIQASIGEDNVRRFLPLVFMLLPKKDEATYIAEFEELTEIASQVEIELDPNLLMTDFELAQLNAARKVFEGASTHGCYFHLCQNMYKKVQQLGYQTTYGGSYRVQLIFKQLTSLAFLPASEIPKAFDELKEISSNMLPNLFDYFSDYYVHGKQLSRKKRRAPVFPPTLWSVHENVLNSIPRTSNNLEGWHCKWNGLLKAGYPSFYSVVKQFQLEESSVNAELLRVLQGIPSIKRVRKVVELDEKLQQIVKSYDRTKNLDFLTGIALTIMNSN